MPRTSCTNSSKLAIFFADGAHKRFAPGDTIVGHISRTNFLQRGIVAITVRLCGRAKTKIRQGQDSDHVFKCHYFSDGTQELTQVVHNGPVDIAADLDSSESWPFALTIPESVHMRPDTEMMRCGLLPAIAEDFALHRLPDTFKVPMGFPSGTEGYIEYYIEAKMQMTGESDVVATHPIIVRSQAPHELSDFSVKQWEGRFVIATYNLQPNIQELTLSQKWRKFSHSSKLPRFTGNMVIQVPTVIQLCHKATLPIMLSAVPLDSNTSDAIKEYDQTLVLKGIELEISIDSVVAALSSWRTLRDQGSAKHLTRLNEEHFERLERPILVPIGADQSPVDVGTIFQLHLKPNGLYSAGTKVKTPTVARLQPDFTTFNIGHSHSFTWRFFFDLAGEEFSKRFTKRTKIVAAAAQDEELPAYEAPPYKA